jgi:two-component SAPR family response regulator
MAQSLEGVRVLVVEDDYLIAQLLDEMLRSIGCVVLGPLPRLADALDAAARETCDVAVLDVNLGGERVYPVAEVLSERNVPFVFVTGYSSGALPREYAEQPRLGKPFKAQQLIRALSNLVEVPIGR